MRFQVVLFDLDGTVVDSGGKSLHGWFRVDGLNTRDQVRFFWVACLLGADPTRWDVCGWLRMPAGLRVVNGVPATRQRIIHFNTDTANA
jgi:phosphoglycolate phosphatase-like HAD superfamily hydrolase